MSRAAALVFVLAFAFAVQAPAQSTKQRRVDRATCTTDGLIHAEASPKTSRRVRDSIRVLEPGIQVRDSVRLTLPCGFHLDPRYGWNLVLTNGTEVRRYLENNAFGFAPAFGLGAKVTKSYTLNYRVAADGELHPDNCGQRLKGIKGAPELCSGFGSGSPFFGTRPGPKGTRVGHFVSRGANIEEDFPVADVDGRVESIFFLPPPDAPGGTITLILSNDQGTFRTYLDIPKG